MLILNRLSSLTIAPISKLKYFVFCVYKSYRSNGKTEVILLTRRIPREKIVVPRTAAGQQDGFLGTDSVIKG